ncbi:hypothetical protein [Alkalinema sp. FACHB-956]|uniref:hypothetical protein n=1 Tax=Alkalinema sp. FACHB-956 TaxID=2692768 RepID=UPI0016886CA2|nr:hypothetical protein [Alkalinema sp. FACHB-956]MBD2326993.1 hypothetical protein [Alkalinema sp. FACHB-956]
MKYQAQLTPWVIYQISAEQRIPVSRFRRRNDADAYLKVLRSTKPGSEFLVAFDTESFAQPDKAAEGKELATV